MSDASNRPGADESWIEARATLGCIGGRELEEPLHEEASGVLGVVEGCGDEQAAADAGHERGVHQSRDAAVVGEDEADERVDLVRR